MTVKEYLMEYKAINNTGESIELRDILNDGVVYCGGGYEQMIEELSKVGLKHIANARFVCRYPNDEDNCIILGYIKDIEFYSSTVLEQVANKMVLK